MFDFPLYKPFKFPLKWRDEILPEYFMNEDSIIYSVKGNKFLQPFPNKEKRPCISVSIDRKKSIYRLDYLTAYTIYGYVEDAIRLIHLDEDDWNCNIRNLKWLRKSDIVEKYKSLYNVDKLEDIQEEWKIYHTEIRGHIIEVSNFGSVRDINSKEELVPTESHGYLVFFYKGNVFHIHRMVAELFVENERPEKYDQVNHLNGVKNNNIFYNLEWCNNSMNTEHSHLSNLFTKYDEKIIHNICKLLSEGLSHIQISIITGANRKYISKIATGYRNKQISSQYNIPKKLPLSEIYNKDLIIKLMNSGCKPKEIASLIKVNYDQSFISYYERIRRERFHT